jgi:type IV fimbrial biogenesis protein FimT
MFTSKGFTLLELMVSASIISILLSIAIPSFNNFIIEMRVDNEISQLYRLLFIARNAAINNDHNVTVCPLNTSSQCSSNWQQELSVFIDLNENKTYEPNSNEQLLKIKAAIVKTDKLHYGMGRNSIVYAPTGRLSGWGQNGTFRYCPSKHQEKNRGIRVATSGRLYITTDTDNDNIDEDRSGKELKCR